MSVEFTESIYPLIQPTVSGISTSGQLSQVPLAKMLPSLSERFALGWSHYVELLTIADRDERRFYEIEATDNQWSVRELQRQISSSLSKPKRELPERRSRAGGPITQAHRNAAGFVAFKRVGRIADKLLRREAFDLSG